MSEFETTLDGKPVKVLVRKPTVSARERSRLAEARAFREACEAGAFRRSQLEALAAKSPSDAARLAREARERIEANLRKIPDERGRLREKGVTREQARDAAVQVRIDRIRLQALSAERADEDAKTADAIASNAGFDVLVSLCAVFADGDRQGEPVFESVEDYKERNNRNEDVAVRAATALAYLNNDLDPDWEKKLPEYRYLESVDYFRDEKEAEPELFGFADEVPAGDKPEASAGEAPAPASEPAPDAPAG